MSARLSQTIKSEPLHPSNVMVPLSVRVNVMKKSGGKQQVFKVPQVIDPPRNLEVRQ